MPRRLWLAAAMLATGAVLIGSAQLAGAAPERTGGIFKYGTTGASVEVDPQVANVNTSWWMQYATAAKLFNYTPKGKLVPEVASRFTVSQRGTRYTFFIRKGFRFSDGEPVRAAHFNYAFDRLRSPQLASGAAQFADNVRSVRARGNRLIVNLTRPDDRLVSKLTLPFFQATSTKLPLDREILGVDSVDDLPSAGPYAFTLNQVNRLTQLRRNPYWKPGPGRTAPRNLDGVDVYWNMHEEGAFQMVERRELDQGPVPARARAVVVSRYGLNRTRFWVKATPCVGFIAFNNASGLFKGNRAMRRAVNWALDRTDYVGQAAAYSSAPWTHILPPGVLGSMTEPSVQPYSTRANIAKARRLAAGHFKNGRITVYYRSTSTIISAQAQIVRRDLVNLGFEPENLTMRGFFGSSFYTAIFTRGSEFDLAVSLGSCHEYAHPVRSFVPFGDNPPWFPDSPKYRDKIARAQPADLGKLDLEIMRNLAPFAVMNTINDLYFFSDRVDPRSITFHRVYTGWSIPSLALK